MRRTLPLVAAGAWVALFAVAPWQVPFAVACALHVAAACRRLPGG